MNLGGQQLGGSAVVVQFDSLIDFHLSPIIQTSVEIYLGHYNMSRAVTLMSLQAVLTDPESSIQITLLAVGICQRGENLGVGIPVK
jgi:hypothetical protein